ncbi:DEAD/DEAH box helicase [Engelhardtia mirabilis]|uniref:RNA polymerase-associated protein RapA n=1 Tax=Engelhardtia mirabilis TaxID=2528011 RepID=A0A518BE39_9BACT|nr:RNA polymerase-associated protein RapA [Planctomycetes bacterium Pla133]QDU99581.1 RNA polymerase-associated protein RapA [Planctomycetes bacterium Pla86]
MAVGRRKIPTLRSDVVEGRLTSELAHHFNARSRKRASDYLSGTAEKYLDFSTDGARTEMVGTDWYELGFRWIVGTEVCAIGGFCSCPAFERAGSCKHLWALLLLIESRRRGPALPDGIEVLYESLSTLEELDDDDFEWLEYFGLSQEEIEGSVGSPETDDADGEGSRGSAAPRQLALAPALARTLISYRDPWTAAGAQEHTIRYVVSAVGAADDELIVLVFRHRRLRNGEWDGGRPATVGGPRDPGFDDPVDARIHGMLTGSRGDVYRYWSSPKSTGQYAVSVELALTLMPALARTGRLWIVAGGDGKGKRLGPYCYDEQPTWHFTPTLEPLPDGKELQIAGRLVRAGEELDLGAVEALTPGGFLFARGCMAHVEPLAAVEFARSLRQKGPVLVPWAARKAAIEFLARVPGFDPERIEGLELAPQTPPIPHLFVEPAQQRFGRTADLQCAISFDYGGARVAATHPGAFATDGAGRLVPRDLGAEGEACAAFLHAGGRRSVGDYDEPDGCIVPGTKLQQLVLALLGQGWTVNARGHQWRQPSGTRVSVTSGIDWFELEGGVDFGDGVTVSLPALLAAAREGAQTVELGDGSVGILPERWLESWGLLELAGETKGDKLRFSRNQGWLLDALLAEREGVRVDAGFAQLRRKLAGFRGVAPKREPRGFRGELRTYQREGLGWFAFLRELGLGGCLADDMGLGKTVQVLALLEARRAGRRRKGGVDRPSMVVAPRSVVFNWIAEAERFAPKLRVLDYTGKDRFDRAEDADDADLWVTTYGTLRRDAAELVEREFDYVVLDEAQAIKNPQSQSAKAARLLRAEQRLALSGTPIENHLGELWSIFEFLNPGMLGRSRGFKQFTRGQGARGAEAPDLARLSSAIAPFFLRRTKAEVLDDLPEKTEQVLHCDLTGAERREYVKLRDYYRAALTDKIEDLGIERAGIQVLEALLRLRQAACHPGLIDRARKAESSAKVDLLMENVENVLAEGHKALIFSQFTSLLSIVRDRLQGRGIVYEYLDGRTRKREEKVARFQTDPDCPLFLISIKAGGAGLNLTAADYVFLLDPWWNPAVEAQAIDRVHRIGRTKPVIAYRLIARDTVEEKVVELQAAKRDLADAVLGQNRVGLRDLTREDLQQLLT